MKNKDNNIFDILVVGAGVTGSMICRELSRYLLNVAVIDKESDVGNVTSNANSAIIHSGYDPYPGTLKAKFNVLGNQMFDKIADELDVSFKRIGSLTVIRSEDQFKDLENLKLRSEQNGVEVKILNKEETLKLEPNLSKDIKGALFAPTAGIIDPFNLCVHTMENAVDNGVKLFLNETVISIKYQGSAGFFEIKTDKNIYFSKVIINAAGLNSDKIAAEIDEIDWKITPKKGEYYVLDHFSPNLVNHVIFPLPSSKGKGTLVTITTSGNYLIGPSNDEVLDVEDFATDKLTLDKIKEQSSLMISNIPFNQTIRTFSGLRPSGGKGDFIIEYSKSNKYFINVAGIESPGLVSSPAIGKYVVEELVRPLFDTFEENKNYNPRIKKYICLNKLSEKERNELIKQDPNFGEIVCSCEKVTLGEILQTLQRSVPPTTLKGIKRRVRAGFGKCQGGFCSPKVSLILAKYLGVSPLDIKRDKSTSNILKEEIKEAK